MYFLEQRSKQTTSEQKKKEILFQSLLQLVNAKHSHTETLKKVRNAAQCSSIKATPCFSFDANRLKTTHTNTHILTQTDTLTH